jgi:hypothetical protein
LISNPIPNLYAKNRPGKPWIVPLSLAVFLRSMFYNFERIHKTLRVTPAMEAGVTDHVWSLEEITGLAD